jgi:hypothetical protein
MRRGQLFSSAIRWDQINREIFHSSSLWFPTLLPISVGGIGRATSKGTRAAPKGLCRESQASMMHERYPRRRVAPSRSRLRRLAQRLSVEALFAAADASAVFAHRLENAPERSAPGGLLPGRSHRLLAQYRQKGFGTNFRKSRTGADQYACRGASNG